MRLMNKNEYEAIKSMQLEGFTIESTRKQTKRSWELVRDVFASKDFESFRTSSPSKGTIAPTGPPQPVSVATQLEAKRDAIVAHYNAVIADLRKEA